MASMERPATMVHREATVATEPGLVAPVRQWAAAVPVAVGDVVHQGSAVLLAAQTAAAVEAEAPAAIMVLDATMGMCLPGGMAKSV